MVCLIQTQSLGLTGLTPTLAGLTLGLLTLANARAIPLLKDLSLCTLVPLLQSASPRFYTFVYASWYFKSYSAESKPNKAQRLFFFRAVFSSIHSFPSGSFAIQTVSLYSSLTRTRTDFFHHSILFLTSKRPLPLKHTYVCRECFVFS